MLLYFSIYVRVWGLWIVIMLFFHRERGKRMLRSESSWRNRNRPERERFVHTYFTSGFVPQHSCSVLAKAVKGF